MRVRLTFSVLLYNQYLVLGVCNCNMARRRWWCFVAYGHRLHKDARGVCKIDRGFAGCSSKAGSPSKALRCNRPMISLRDYNVFFHRQNRCRPTSSRNADPSARSIFTLDTGAGERRLLTNARASQALWINRTTINAAPVEGKQSSVGLDTTQRSYKAPPRNIFRREVKGCLHYSFESSFEKECDNQSVIGPRWNGKVRQ